MEIHKEIRTLWHYETSGCDDLPIQPHLLEVKRSLKRLRVLFINVPRVTPHGKIDRYHRIQEELAQQTCNELDATFILQRQRHCRSPFQVGFAIGCKSRPVGTRLDFASLTNAPVESTASNSYKTTAMISKGQ